MAGAVGARVMRGWPTYSDCQVSELPNMKVISRCQRMLSSGTMNSNLSQMNDPLGAVS